ncbi:unnamed protein product [Brassica rapa subsp. narinosa]
MDRTSSRWKGANMLVFNTAHWWSHYKTKSGGGEWNSGGHCREAKKLLNQTFKPSYSGKNIILEEVHKQMKTPVTLLNVSGLSQYRIDAHPSIFGAKPENQRSQTVQDCSHWCLPGVPDTWNHFLYLHLLHKR